MVAKVLVSGIIESNLSVTCRGCLQEVIKHLGPLQWEGMAVL